MIRSDSGIEEPMSQLQVLLTVERLVAGLGRMREATAAAAKQPNLTSPLIRHALVT